MSMNAHFRRAVRAVVIERVGAFDGIARSGRGMAMLLVVVDLSVQMRNISAHAAVGQGQDAGHQQDEALPH